MKRPALAVSIPVIAAAITAVLLPEIYLYIIIAALFLIFIAGFIVKSVHMKAISGFMLAVFLSFALQNLFLFKQDAKYEGRVLHISARVESSDGDRVVLKINKAYDKDRPVKLKGRVRAEVFAKKLPKRYEFIEGDFLIRLPGASSSRVRVASYADGIYLDAYQKGDIVIEKEGYTSPFDIVYHLRRYIASVTDKVGGEEGEFLLSLLTGQNDGLSQETKDNFRVLGLSHIMAVSGLHLSIIIGMIIALIGLLKIPRIPKQVICILFTLVVGVAASFSPSVCRAGIMGLTIYVGAFFGRQSESLNSLGVAFIICLTASPCMIFDAGFILSSAATLGIIFFCPVLNRFIFKIKSSFIRRILQMTAVAFCASVYVLPVSVYYFGEASLVGVIAGIAIEIFVYFLIIGGMLLCILGFIPGVSTALAYMMRCCARLVLTGAEFYGARLDTAEFLKIPLLIWFIFVLFVAVMYYFFADKLNRRIGALAVVGTFILCFAFSVSLSKKEMYIINENSGKISLSYIEDGDRLIIADCEGELSAQRMQAIMNEKRAGKCDCLILGAYTRERLLAAEYIINNRLCRTIVLPDIEDASKYDIMGMAKNAGIAVIAADEPMVLDEIKDGTAGTYAGKGEYFPDSMYFIYRQGDFTFMDTYCADILPAADADLTFCDLAPKSGKMPKGCLIVGGTSLHDTENAIIGRGYKSIITVYSNGKYSIKRDRI